MAWALSDSVPVRYFDKLREYGIEIQDGGSSFLSLAFCPFCGSELPPSLRETWIDRLETLGLEAPFDDGVPSNMQSGAWWRADVTLNPLP